MPGIDGYENILRQGAILIEIVKLFMGRPFNSLIPMLTWTGENVGSDPSCRGFTWPLIRTDTDHYPETAVGS